MRRAVTAPMRLLALCALAAGAAACTTSGQVLPTKRALRSTPTNADHARPKATTPAPSPAPGVDLHSASGVAVAYVEATWTLNTTVDTGWYAGELAASAYITPRYAALIRENRGSESPGATWLAWAAHRTVTSVSAQVEDDPGSPMSTALIGYRKVIATVTPHGTAIGTETAASSEGVTPADSVISGEPQSPDSAFGWVGQSEIWITYLVLSRTSIGASWRVALSETTR
jgi:hypothetical protein